MLTFDIDQKSNGMKDSQKIKQLYKDNAELGLQLIYATLCIPNTIFGSIGYTIRDMSKPPVPVVESFFILEQNEASLKALKGVQLYQQANASRMHKNFILNMANEELVEELMERRKQDPEELARMILKLDIKFFKI